MNVIIAGSRSLVLSVDQIDDVVKRSGFEVTTVISGNARGVDTSGENWAIKKGIRLVRYPANWDLYGKSAGAIRNQHMASIADALIAIHDMESPGTSNMIKEAKKRGLQVYVTSSVLLPKVPVSTRKAIYPKGVR